MLEKDATYEHTASETTKLYQLSQVSRASFHPAL